MLMDSSSSTSAARTPFYWYIPTMHGDIRLERGPNDTTRMRVFELAPTEEAALHALREKALRGSLIGGPWASAKDFAPLDDLTLYRSKAGVTIHLRASIKKVRNLLGKHLKKGRSLVDAYVFSDGRLEEVRYTVTTDDDGEKVEEPVLPTAEEKKEEPKAAATVAAPTIGCPVPNFPEHEVRATEVLRAFLKPQQLSDYEKDGVFMARGADTGHQYAITHRNRRASMQSVSFRSLYDMTEGRPMCVHDWSVPAPEEMLALLLCVSLPGHESRVRALPEAFPLGGFMPPPFVA